ncbi:hypothetical protein [Streptomyces sp. TS71-3]|uniref:hypothetical protein n=1 Tax=Streptomyces sp. TS71-3 TaxID=2733862 RepID=UPI001BB42BEF|nr:hypothetical protein [Streptomyces sp. TS71-3]
MSSYIQDHPAEFGGSYLDEQTHTLHVLTVGGATSLKAQKSLSDLAIRSTATTARSESAGPEWTLSTQAARYSMATLQETRDRVSEAFAREAGNNLTIWYADPRTDTVHIGLNKVKPRLVKLASEDFGDRVTVAQEEQHKTMDKRTKVDGPVSYSHRTPELRDTGVTKSGTAASTPTRLLDSVPYAGGDRIVSTQTIDGVQYIVECTVNFDFVTSSGSPAMGTAGHCGPTGLSWRQGYYDESAQTIHYTGTMGSAYTRIWGNGKSDAELLNDTGNPDGFWPQVYTTSTALENVGSVSPVSVGQKICADGSFTLQSCYGMVTATNVCENVNDDGTIVKVCNLDVAEGVGGTLVQSGDSGGPVYTSGTPHHPLGIISAGTADGLTLDFADMGSVDISLNAYPESSS